jgi:hypothetical protein
MQAKRLFAGVAVAATDELRRVLEELRRGLREERIRWMRLEKLHLTVEFFGFAPPSGFRNGRRRWPGPRRTFRRSRCAWPEWARSAARGIRGCCGWAWNPPAWRRCTRPRKRACGRRAGRRKRGRSRRI